MRLIKKLSTGWLLVACVASFNSYAMPSARKADMDAVVKNAAEDAMRQHGIPGLAIAIAAGGEQWFYSYGVASKKTEQKITEDTIFEIGSVSKTLAVGQHLAQPCKAQRNAAHERRARARTNAAIGAVGSDGFRPARARNG